MRALQERRSNSKTTKNACRDNCYMVRVKITRSGARSVSRLRIASLTPPVKIHNRFTTADRKAALTFVEEISAGHLSSRRVRSEGRCGAPIQPTMPGPMAGRRRA
jgi:hypothetical protein